MYIYMILYKTVNTYDYIHTFLYKIIIIMVVFLWQSLNNTAGKYLTISSWEGGNIMTCKLYLFL